MVLHIGYTSTRTKDSEGGRGGRGKEIKRTYERESGKVERRKKGEQRSEEDWKEIKRMYGGNG